jgi:hypothetical protein
LIDEYTLRARVAPVLIVLAPLAAFLTTGILDVRIALLSGAFGLAAFVLLAQFGRDAGKRREPDLWESWGGAPTTRLLRYRGNETERVRALHLQIERAVGESLPSHDDEANDPAAADSAYEHAVLLLRERTRDKDRFPLVFSENADYGFRRNLFGLRSWGVAIALVTVGGSALIVAGRSGDLSSRIYAVALPVATSVACFGLFVYITTPSWVRAAADRYAERLFGALAELA